MPGVDILCVFPLSGVTARGLNAPAEAMYTDLQRVGEEFIKSVEKLVGVLDRVSCCSHRPLYLGRIRGVETFRSLQFGSARFISQWISNIHIYYLCPDGRTNMAD